MTRGQKSAKQGKPAKESGGQESKHYTPVDNGELMRCIMFHPGDVNATVDAPRLLSLVQRAVNSEKVVAKSKHKPTEEAPLTK